MNPKIKHAGKWTLIVLVVIFALIGLLFTGVLVGMRFGIFDVRGSIADRNASFGTSTSAVGSSTAPCIDITKSRCDWDQTPEWTVIDSGLLKDQDIISQVSSETGVSKRMIAAVVVPEQIRFLTSDRELFESYFEPLKILGSMSMFSLGVSGIKEQTATQIENYANDPSSPFYPGPGIAPLLAYAASSTDHDTQLFNRLTDSKNHYYSYLYTAAYVKEIEAQWKAAGYDVSQNPEAVTTLFNIGFGDSHPNPTPMAGGAPITTGGMTYTYGSLGAAFYDSDEEIVAFPKV